MNVMAEFPLAKAGLLSFECIPLGSFINWENLFADEFKNKSTAADRKTNRRHEKMGAERNASVAQIAIAWAIAKGTLPLVGATKVHHVLDAACASDIQLRDEEIILLEQLAAETRVDTRGAGKNRWCKARPEQTVMNDTHERAVPGDSNLYHFYCFV